MDESDLRGVLFLDTNVLLHFTTFDEVDWRPIAGSHEVLLVISFAVTKNLDKLKYTHPQRRIKERARTLLRKLASFESSSASADLRAGVRLELLRTAPLFDFTAAQLDPQDDDDRLVASILTYRCDNPDSAPRLVTADFGLTLKARHHHIGVVAMPDEFRLPDEPDADERKLRELELRERQLKAALPQLRVTFPGDRTMMEVQLSAPAAQTLDIDAGLRVIMAKHPKVDRSLVGKQNQPTRSDVRVAPTSEDAKLIDVMRDLAVAAPPQVVENFNQSLDTFYGWYRQYLETKQWFLFAGPRTQPVSLILHNDGGKPADDVDMYLVGFPENVGLSPTPPIEPTPPMPPWNPWNPSAPVHSVAWPGSGLLPTEYMLPDWKTLGATTGHQANRGPFIESGDITRAHFHVDRLKHGFQVELPPLFLTFPVSSDRFAFRLQYRIYCGSNPLQDSGFVDLVIELKTGLTTSQ